MRIIRALHVCLWLLCFGSTARVAASELVLEWTAPPSCPDKADVMSRVGRLLGDAATANLTATVDVTQTAANYQGRLRITSASGFGERALENARCDVLADSVALVIALSAARAPTPHSDANIDNQDDIGLALSAHATAVTGPLPTLALGAGAAVAVEGLSALRLEVSGSYYARQSSTFDQMDVGARFSLLRFGARVCRTWRVGVFDLAPCLGAQLYRIEGAGFGGAVRRTADSLVWAPLLGVFARLRLLERFAVYIALDGAAPLSRQRFVFSDLGPLHRPSLFAFQLFVAPEVRF